MRGSYRTKQFTRILEFLSESPNDSVSAKEIHSACHEMGMDVALATIYRQLEHLTKDAKVKKIVTGEGGMRYQYVQGDSSTNAYYLKCEDCGKLMQTNCHLLLEVSDHMNEEHGFEIDAGKSVLYGRCKNCRT